MAGCREGVRISKASLEIALIFTAICLKAPTMSGVPYPFYFQSIDCGGTQPDYTENGIAWVTDNGTYMDLGKSIEQPSIDSAVDPLGYNQSLLSYRYFPAPGSAESRNKYCYELTIPDNSYPYLLRVGFYQNSSLLNAARPFEFIVSADATNWFTVTSGDESANPYLFEIQEGIFHPRLSVMSICLKPVFGEAFISSLELRVLDKNMYSYQGWTSQYLSTKQRFNVGPIQWSPAVRYPQDLFDRIWITSLNDVQGILVNIVDSQAPDILYERDAYYVPPTVMQDAWLFPNDVDVGIYWQIYVDGSMVYMTPAETHFVVVYVENLNASVVQPYDMSIGLDFIPYDLQGTVSNNVTFLVYPYFVLEGNSLVFSAVSNSSLSHLPMNALEIYGQYSYNLSTTNSDDVSVIDDLKTAFSLTDWRGDPCIPVPHDWLSCNVSIPVLGNLHDPCLLNSSSSKPCAPKFDLQSRYYVTSLNISHRSTSDFSSTIQLKQLNRLQEMSITSSGVDNLAFQFLVNYTSQALNILDLSYNNLTGAVSPFENMPFFQTLQYLNLSHNALTTFPDTWRNTTETLVALDMSYNQLQGNVSSLDKWVEINNGSLQDIYMSNNKLSGTFSSDLYFSSLPNLVYANFDDNFILGTLNLSTWYDALQQATTNLSASNVPLQLFSFVNNNISSIVPSAEEFDFTISNLIISTNQSFYKKGILLGGNPYCNSPSSYIHQFLCRFSVDEDIQRHKKHNDDSLIIGIVGGVVGLLLIFCFVSVTLWKLWMQVYNLRKIQQALTDRKVQPPFYHYSDLKSATRDFHKDNKLGHGGYGIVYKARLTDETLLAVKKLFNSRRLKVLDEFLNEVVLITGIKHRNLVQLRGCCLKDKQRMLIYEYVEKGNLAEALWGSRPHGGLNWDQRFKICVGVARGLAYLHEELLPSIIHRDIKPENILLDMNYNPKIADFGLARHISEEQSQAYTQVAGTLGYFAPEYAMQGQLSEKVDVYSYGILILNVVSGRMCIDPSRPPEEKFLKAWVTTLFKKKLLFDILQPELRNNCVMEEVVRAIKIGLLCVQQQPEMRPTMSQVVIMFLGSLDLEIVLDKFDNIHSNPNKLYSTIDMQNPTLQIIEEDSNTVPLVDLHSLSSLRSFVSSSNSRPFETELTSPRLNDVFSTTPKFC